MTQESGTSYGSGCAFSAGSSWFICLDTDPNGIRSNSKFKKPWRGWLNSFHFLRLGCPVRQFASTPCHTYRQTLDSDNWLLCVGWVCCVDARSIRSPWYWQQTNGDLWFISKRRKSILSLKPSVTSVDSQLLNKRWSDLKRNQCETVVSKVFVSDSYLSLSRFSGVEI